MEARRRLHFTRLAKLIFVPGVSPSFYLAKKVPYFPLLLHQRRNRKVFSYFPQARQNVASRARIANFFLSDPSPTFSFLPLLPSLLYLIFFYFIYLAPSRIFHLPFQNERREAGRKKERKREKNPGEWKMAFKLYARAMNLSVTNHWLVHHSIIFTILISKDASVKKSQTGSRRIQ